MLELERVSIAAAHYRWFGRREWRPLLREVSLTVAPGEVVALVGGSGEGKSLLLLAALDLLPANLRLEGALRFAGAPLDRQRSRQLRGREIGYVPQGVGALNPLLRVEGQLTRGLRLGGWRGERAALEAQFARLALPAAALDLYPRQLSGGMAKRILACHAALSNARLILADEVTAWLDEAAASLLLAQLRGLAAQGCGVLWVTHDLALAARFADRVVALHQGRVSDTLAVEALRRGEGSAPLRAHWQALPEQRGWEALSC